MIFPTRVNGIPCQCRVTTYSPPEPPIIYGSGFGDADPGAAEEFEFELLDKKGYRAKWLEEYITDKEELRLLGEYMNYVSAMQYDYQDMAS